MFKAGIIDPVKVTRSALQNAASIAGMVLSTDTLITDVRGTVRCGMPAWHGRNGWHGRHGRHDVALYRDKG